jgi:hypothetical protein
MRLEIDVHPLASGKPGGETDSTSGAFRIETLKDPLCVRTLACAASGFRIAPEFTLGLRPDPAGASGMTE